MFDENTKEDIVQNLQKLDLSRKDSLVYLSLLHLGEVGSSKIMNDTSLHGQYVYQSLERLEKLGLAQHVIKHGRKKFSAKSPENLRRLADQQKTIADNVAAKLEELVVLPPDHTFEVFQGRDSYVAHEFELLKNANNGSELLVIGGSGDKFNQAMKERLAEYSHLQTKKEIHIRYIGSEAQREKTEEMHGSRNLFKIRYLPGLFTGEVNTNIWPDALGFNIFSEPVTRFTVRSNIVAGSYRQFFETLWKLAKP